MTIQCAQCKEEVNDGATKCPHCEYKPGDSMVLVGGVAIAIGILISLTLVGAIVGVPMAAFGLYRLYKGSNLTVDSEYGT